MLKPRLQSKCHDFVLFFGPCYPYLLLDDLKGFVIMYLFGLILNFKFSNHPNYINTFQNLTLELVN